MNWDNHLGKKRKIYGVYSYERIPHAILHKAFFIFQTMPDGSFYIVKDYSQNKDGSNLTHDEFCEWLDKAREFCDKADQSQENQDYTGTISELADKYTINGLKATRTDWSVFLRLAEKCGAAQKIKTIPAKSGRGKPSVVWQVSDFTVSICTHQNQSN
jgi:hypothetical protein